MDNNIKTLVGFKDTRLEIDPPAMMIGLILSFI